MSHDASIASPMRGQKRAAVDSTARHNESEPPMRLEQSSHRPQKRLRLSAPVEALSTLANAGLELVCYGAAIGLAVYNSVGSGSAPCNSEQLTDTDNPPPYDGYHLVNSSKTDSIDAFVPTVHHIHHHTPPLPAASSHRPRSRRVAHHARRNKSLGFRFNNSSSSSSNTAKAQSTRSPEDELEQAEQSSSSNAAAGEPQASTSMTQLPEEEDEEDAEDSEGLAELSALEERVSQLITSGKEALNAPIPVTQRSTFGNGIKRKPSHQKGLSASLPARRGASTSGLSAFQHKARHSIGVTPPSGAFTFSSHFSGSSQAQRPHDNASTPR